MLVSACVCDNVVRVMQPPECQNFDAETNFPHQHLFQGDPRCLRSEDVLRSVNFQ